MAKARFSIRLEESVKLKAEKAAALLGMKSLTDYVVRLLEADANQVISYSNALAVEDDCFDQFVLACENSCEPNECLKAAFAFTKSQGYV